MSECRIGAFGGHGVTGERERNFLWELLGILGTKPINKQDGTSSRFGRKYVRIRKGVQHIPGDAGYVVIVVVVRETGAPADGAH